MRSGGSVTDEPRHGIQIFSAPSDAARIRRSADGVIALVTAALVVLLIITFALTLTIICAVGSATAAGTFFTFSTFTIACLPSARDRGGAAPRRVRIDLSADRLRALHRGCGDPHARLSRPPQQQAG